MKYFRFEDLPVWKAASDLFVQIDALCEDQQVRLRGDLANQIHRAALSVSNNISESFELGTTQQLITFLYIARGSAGEVRNMLCQMERIPRFQNLKFQISNLKSLAESCSRQLRGFADSLQNSDIKGQRHLTDAQREQAERIARRQAFETRLAALVEDARHKRAAQATQGSPEVHP